MPLLKYTTDVPVHRSIAEIQKVLIDHGARGIMCDYDDGGKIVAITFKIPIDGNTTMIRIPSDVLATQRVLEEDPKVERRYKSREHAERVSWRIIADWVAVQMAILETKMVKMEQVFLPYMVTGNGETVFEHLEKTKFKLLT